MANHHDVVAAVTAKVQILNQRKERLTKEYERQCAEIDEELEALQAALDTVNAAIKDVICPHCDGAGEQRYTDAAGDVDTRKCRSCGGTGIRKFGDMEGNDGKSDN